MEYNTHINPYQPTSLGTTIIGMKYKDGIILEKQPIIIGAGFNNGNYVIKCPKCNKVSTYYYDLNENQIPKYCTYCSADFEETEETENNICATCKLNNYCPLNHKPNLQCPYNDYEKKEV